MKHAIRMPSHQGYCVTYIYGCIKFYGPALRGSWYIWAEKSPTSREKNDIIWSMSMTLKTKNTLATYNVYFNETSDITFKG